VRLRESKAGGDGHRPPLQRAGLHAALPACLLFVKGCCSIRCRQRTSGGQARWIPAWFLLPGFGRL